jgi:uncharacterized membrane protein
MSSNPSTANANLDPNELLIAEFNYIAQTAFQANEDRARVSNYYFVTAGAVIGAILSAKLEAVSVPSVYFGFAGLFFVLSIVGLTILLQLARLRTAWQDSARAMNVIKDYYIHNSKDLNLEPAFLWRTRSIPQAITQGRNIRTVSFLLAISVLVISFGTAVASIAYVSLALAPAFKVAIDMSSSLVIAVISVLVGGVYTFVEFRVYEKWIVEAERKQEQRAQEHYADYKDLLQEYPTP